MNRRGFLTAVLAVVAAPIACLKKPKPETFPVWYLDPRIPTVEVGVPVSECPCTHCKIARQYYQGKISELPSFDWYMDPVVGPIEVRDAIRL